MKADDLVLPEWRSDPYPLYAELRARAPIHRAERMNAWLLTRYVDVAAALRDPRLSSRRSTTPFAGISQALDEEVAPFKQSLELWALFRDPPDHTRLRALLNRGFAPGIIDTLRPQIQGVVEELLQTPTERQALEVVGELAYPLPAIVIAEMIGVPRADRDKFKHWSDDLASLLVPGLKVPQQIEDGLKSWREMEQYLGELIAVRRAEGKSAAPRKDVLGALLSAEEKGSPLSEAEVRATVGLLLFGGHETTTNLITNGVLLLLRHPQALSELRRDPALLATAIEEMLRYESPVQMVSRLADEDLVLADQPVRKGDRIILLLASANRDPAQFPEPDRFHIHRRENRHLAFGLGIHFCIGAALARVEAQLAFRLLFDRFSSMRLADEPIVWRDNLSFRCPQRLQITA